MKPADIVARLNVEIKDYIKVNEYGDACCERTYTFSNNTDEILPIQEKFRWKDQYPRNASDFILTKITSTQNLQSKSYIKCLCCEGTGKHQNQACEVCRGTGKIEKPENIVEFQVAENQNIECGGRIDIAIKYKLSSFAHEFDTKKWVFLYSYLNLESKKVTLNLAIEVPKPDLISLQDKTLTSSKKWLDNWLNRKELKYHSSLTDVKIKDNINIIEGRVPDVDDISFKGLYYYELVRKAWVEPGKITVLGILSIGLFEVAKWVYHYFKGA